MSLTPVFEATSLLASGFPPPPARGIDLPGPFFLAFYTLAIMLGIVAAVIVASKLWKSRGGNSDDVFSAMLWAVLIGIIGARAYHVISSPDAYFGEGGDILRAFQLWHGGLSIIGAVAAGALAVWIFCRRSGIKFPAFADAVVPGILLAQAIGRWGNFFNQELYGDRTFLPWGLRLDTEQQYQAPEIASTTPVEEMLFHPTFLYESLWNLLGFFALLLLFKRFQFRQGLLAWTYVAYYALGRFWIESLRIDELDKSTQYPLDNLGLDWRLNQIIAFVAFVVAIAALIWLFVKRPQSTEEIIEHKEIYTVEARKQAADTSEKDLTDASAETPEEAETGESQLAPAETEAQDRTSS